jgi:hypothetical protein
MCWPTDIHGREVMPRSANVCQQEAFELELGEVDRLVDRLALLSAPRDHFADRTVREHLRAEPRRRRVLDATVDPALTTQ